jgi:hypothetical protein
MAIDQDRRGAVYKRRLDALKGERQQHVTTWEDCYRFTHPMLGTGFYGYDANASQGQNDRARLLDSTGTDSSRNLAAGVQSGVTPSNDQWFDFEVDQETDDERLWLSEAANLLWRNIHASNFDATSFGCNLDGVIAGWFGIYCDEAPGGGFNFEAWPISELYCASSRPGGPIDIVYREFKLTAEQAVEKYGRENLPAKIVMASEKTPDEKYCFCRVIEPRKGGTYGVRSKNLPIASVTVEQESCAIVEEKGYHEQPIIVPRWNIMPGSVYATGPVFDALPDMKQLNLLCGFELAAAELAVAGMWIAEDDGVLNPRQVKVGPRKIIIANSVDSMKPLVTGSNFQVSELMKAQLQGQIRRTLMADQLQPQDGPAMTATEVHVRVELIRQLLGPVYGRLQAEYLQPLVTRCFGIAFRTPSPTGAGIFAPIPDSLRGREFSIKYVSPMARAQQMEGVMAIERLYTDIGAIAAAKQDPAVFDNIDDDEAVRVVQEGLGAPSRIMRKSEDVQKIREARLKAQQQAQQAEQQAALQQEAGSAMIQTAAKQAQPA